MKLKHTLTLLICSFIGLSSFAQQVNAENQAKYLFYLTNYLDWGHNEVTIGVMGSSPTSDELHDLSEDNGNVTVKIIHEIEKIALCDILFLPESQTSEFEVVQREIGLLPIILITENETLASRGAEISFFEANGKLKLALNKQALEETGIMVDSKILSYSHIVDVE